MKMDIDKLDVSKSLIDLDGFSQNSLNSVFIGYDLSQVLDDIILVELVDLGGTSNEIVRNGLIVPVNADTQAWRVGKVILCGQGTSLVKKGDHVIFPNNRGIMISNVEIEGFGTLKHGQFLNEHRIFGIAKPREDVHIKTESKSTRKNSRLRN
jgi:co-chaperonin GroES (HSP10)